MGESNDTKPTVYLFVYDSFSDWEPAYAIAEINKSGKYTVETFALTKDAVTSAGGLTILPCTDIDDERIKQAAMIIIPGGRALEEKKYGEVMPLVEYAYKNNIPIAAICGATTLLADMGMLDDIRHTSNALVYLKQLSSWYKGENYYLDEKAVTGNNIITAGGVYPIEFAREIFIKLSLYNNDMIGKWYQLFKNGVWVE